MAEQLRRKGDAREMNDCQEEETEDGEEYEEDDAEIQDMKAKFNQILANFDNEHSNSGKKRAL